MSVRAWEGAPDAARRWAVYVVNSSHTDPGWHDLPARVMALHAEILDEVVRLCDLTRDEPPHRRFVFTAEHAWTVDYYERHRSPSQFARLMDCCRRGQVEVGAIYAGVHTDLCGHEELARLTRYATGLRRRCGVPVDSALLNDVSEGYTMGLPQVLARAGVRALVMGPGVKAVAKGIQPDLPRLFRWRAPDGSAVLVGWTPGKWTYTDWSEAGFRGEATLAAFEALGDAYPYNAIFRHAGKGDNARPTLGALRALEKTYHESWRRPEVRLARVGEFAAYIERHYGDLVPVYQGDNPNNWADGTLSLARETALYRRAQGRAIAAEALAALAAATEATPLEEYPAAAIDDLYRNLHFYADHTWGLDLSTGVAPGSRLGHAIGHDATVEADGAVTDNTEAGAAVFAEWERNWDAKRAYAVAADRLAREVESAALDALAARLAAPDPQVVVWNTASGPRTDLARLPWLEGWDDHLALVDARTGRDVPWQREIDAAGAAQLAFVAAGVPALGHARYHLERRARAGAPPAISMDVDDGLFIENEYYRVAIDPARGTIASIWDKRLGRELVDRGARYGFGEYIHADVDAGYEGVGDELKAGFAHGEGTRYAPDVVEGVDRVAGPVSSMLRVRACLTGGPAPATVMRTVALHAGLKRVDLTIEVDKRASLKKEQIYVAFPFAVDGPVAARLELPDATLRWERDILPGCWRGYSSVQSWLDVSNEEYGITWSSLDAPVVSLGGIHSNEWDPEWHKVHTLDNGHIYSYVMANIWNCNYALWQGGPMRFAYSLTGHAGPCDPAVATRGGRGHAQPLLARFVAPTGGGRADAAAPDAPPALGLEPDNVVVSALKRADDGDGWIVRLYETGGRARTEARLTIGFIAPRSAELDTLAEERIADLPLDGAAVAVSLAAHELATLRIR